MTSAEGEAEEIAVSAKPRAGPQRHEKLRSNPYSTSGFHNFKSVSGELSAKRRYVAYKIGVPEAMVRFVFSRKGWIPIVIGASDHETGKKSSGGDEAGVSTMGSPVKNNGKMGGELRRKDKGNGINGKFERRDLTVSSPTSPVRSHRDPDNVSATASRRAVNPKKIGREHGHDHDRDHDLADFWATTSRRSVNPNPKTFSREHGIFHHRYQMAHEHEQQQLHEISKMHRRYVSMNTWPSAKPASQEVGSESVGAISVGAFTVILIVLLSCFAILFISAWFCIFPLFRKDEYE